MHRSKVKSTHQPTNSPLLSFVVGRSLAEEN